MAMVQRLRARFHVPADVLISPAQAGKAHDEARRGLTGFHSRIRYSS